MTYTFVTLVVALPAVLYAIVQSIAYPNYRAAWEADSMWDLVIVACLLWSVVVSWRAVLAVFPVRPTRAVWWFLILPIAVYVVVIGAVGALFALAGQ